MTPGVGLELNPHTLGVVSVFRRADGLLQPSDIIFLPCSLTSGIGSYISNLLTYGSAT